MHSTAPGACDPQPETDDIACLYALGITTGTTPTTYSPHHTLTREQAAAFLGRVLSFGIAVPET